MSKDINRSSKAAEASKEAKVVTFKVTPPTAEATGPQGGAIRWMSPAGRGI